MTSPRRRTAPARTPRAKNGAPRSAVDRAAWLEKVLTDSFGMDTEDARVICGVVIEQFGAKEELLDDELPTDVRSIFYTLEAKRILTFRRIEYKGEEGETRRGFFWRFNVTRAEALLDEETDPQGDDDLYASLPADCWERASP